MHTDSIFHLRIPQGSTELGYKIMKSTNCQWSTAIAKAKAEIRSTKTEAPSKQALPLMCV